MKVYARDKETQNFLKTQKLKGITVVDDSKNSNYMITGRFSEQDYNDNLKGIIIPYTGHNRINLEDMRKHHLKLFVTPTRTKYVAEKTVTLTLTLLGNLMNYHSRLKNGDWSKRNSLDRIPWVSIQNKKVGFFGYGRINKLVHKMLGVFNCDFYTINRNKDYKDIKLVNNLDELVMVCDIIIIATPLNNETENIICAQQLELMADKYLINVGRGKIVNQLDLYEALKNGTLKGYASDVWFNYPKGEEQCFPSEYPIHEMDNVVLSNHSGGFTTNTNKEVEEDLVKQLLKLRDNDFKDALDLDKLI